MEDIASLIYRKDSSYTKIYRSLFQFFEYRSNILRIWKKSRIIVTLLPLWSNIFDLLEPIQNSTQFFLPFPNFTLDSWCRYPLVSIQDDYREIRTRPLINGHVFRATIARAHNVHTTCAYAYRGRTYIYVGEYKRIALRWSNAHRFRIAERTHEIA